jgi:hypothetical protein
MKMLLENKEMRGNLNNLLSSQYFKDPYMKTIALLSKIKELSTERKKELLHGIQKIILDFD